MLLTNGSGSGSWIPILLFSSLTFNMPAKKLIFNTIFSAYYFLKVHLHHLLTFNMPAKKLIFNTIFSAYYFLKVHLHHFSKIKSQKASQKIRNQGLSYYFCMIIEGSGSGSLPLTSESGSGSWRPKNMWIRWIRIRRIRLRNTARNPCFSPDEAVGAAPLLDLSLQAHLLPEQGWQ
jgi:hypothetical protein